MSEYPVVVVSVIKRHDDSICRKTAERVRMLEPAAFVIIGPFTAIVDRIRDAVGTNSSVAVIPDEENHLITILSTNAYYAQHPGRNHQDEASRLFQVLRGMVTMYSGSLADA